MTDETQEPDTTIGELFQPEPETDEGTGEESTVEETAEDSPTETAEVAEESPPPGEEQPSANEAQASEIAGLKAALAAERKKRQAAEESVKPPDPVEDPEGYAAHLENRQAQSEWKLKAEISRSVVASLKDDYAEKEKVFVEMAETNPSLIQQMRASENPAMFAYDVATEHLEVQQLRDPAYIDKLVEEKAKALIAEMSDGKKTALDVPNVQSMAAAGKNSDKSVEEITEIKDLF